MQENKNFNVVKTTDAKAKNGAGSIYIETSVKGLIYRCEAYMESHLIDAMEVNCSDISTVDRYEDIFEARYNATHRKFEELYTQARIYSKVLSTEGAYMDGEGSCQVITSISDNVIACEVFLDNNQIDEKIENVDKAQAAEVSVFKAKYTQLHKDNVANYIKVLKFPANTFLNPILKKFPMYKKNPMYSLGFFLATVVLVLWILSLIICGKALPKIVAAVAGKQAGMIAKDLKKSVCKKSKTENLAEGEKIIQGSDGSQMKVTTNEDGTATYAPLTGPAPEDFVVLPKNIIFKDVNQVQPVYIKNNLGSDIVVSVKNRIIFEFNDALVSPEMIINILTPKALHINAGDIGTFEFKLQKEFLQSSTLEERMYHGSIVLEAIDVKTRTAKPITVDFDFPVKKAE